MHRTILIATIAFYGLLAACAPTATIADLEDDKVIVQGNGYDMSVVDAEAAKGCAIHGKKAQRISYTCADGYCIQKNYLYACHPPSE